MDTLGYLRSVSPSQASALIRGLLNNALLLTRTKTNLVFQAAQPVLEFKSAAPSNEDSPP